MQVEYTGEDGTKSEEMCNVVAIYKFWNKNTKVDEIYIVICWLKRMPDSIRECWPLYSYWLNGGKLWYDIVSIDTVKQPAFIVPWSSTKCSWLNQPKDITSQLFKCIPYDKVHRDSCYDLVQYSKRADIANKENKNKKRRSTTTTTTTGPSTSSSSSSNISNNYTTNVVCHFDELPVMLHEEERNILLNTMENYLIGLNITDDIQSNNLDELDQGDTPSVIHEGTDIR